MTNPIASIFVPIFTSVLSQHAGQAGITQANVPVVARQMAEQVVANPVVKNQVNAEPLTQSRVVWGNVIAAIGVLLPIILSLFGIDVSEEEIAQVVSAVVTIGGILYSLYGRIKGGLAPLFSRWSS